MTDFGKVLTIEPNDINIVASPSEKYEILTVASCFGFFVK